MFAMNGVDRKAFFFQKVKDIIAHNTNPSYTWKKGLSEYSDLTNEEFNDYFHIIKDP